ncbi:hypothetical protein BpHYR1_019481 [Brachionus plicatilis]|uniref:Uncharacterized protein n=1 Tax=Brachionus plicatilis TaxID=10195 RepID=A0A3M7RCN8_BRAPC|nr:hypothetical protein BpHYR1_019481 [Brachionus plicatilis]
MQSLIRADKKLSLTISLFRGREKLRVETNSCDSSVRSRAKPGSPSTTRAYSCLTLQYFKIRASHSLSLSSNLSFLPHTSFNSAQ